MLLCSDGAIVSETLNTDMREHMFRMLCEVLDEVDPSWVPIRRDRYALALEHGVLLWSGGLRRRYMRKMVFVYAVLKMWNVHMVKKLPPPWKFAFAREASFSPRLRNANEDDSGRVEEVERVLTHISSLADKSKRSLKCKSCGSDQIEDVAIQTRSADEGMTYFHRCCICSSTFK